MNPKKTIFLFAASALLCSCGTPPELLSLSNPYASEPGVTSSGPRSEASPTEPSHPAAFSSSDPYHGSSSSSDRSNPRDSSSSEASAEYSQISSSSSTSTRPDLTYACPEVETDFLKGLVADFKVAYPQYAGEDITCSTTIGEGEAFLYLRDRPENAADVLLASDDNVIPAAREGLIAESPYDQFGQNIVPFAIDTCSYNGKLFGYPYVANNSPMPIYATDFYSEQDVTSLETILQKAEQAGKKVYLDIEGAWYNSFLVWAGGADFWTDGDSNTLYTDAAGSKIDDVAASLDAFKSLYNQYKRTIVLSSDSGKIEAGFKSGELAYCLLWNDFDQLKGIHNDLGVATWPTMNIKGTPVPLECFGSSRAAVVNNAVDEEKLPLAHAFASYIASAEAQKKRVAYFGTNPTDITAAEDLSPTMHPFGYAVNQMAQQGRLHPMSRCTNGYFWNPMCQLGMQATNGLATWGDSPTSKAALQSLVSNEGWASAERE